MLSVAQDVKSNSEGCIIPKYWTICCRAVSIAFRTGFAASYMELGLKYSCCKKGIIASLASGAIIVVALLSR